MSGADSSHSGSSATAEPAPVQIDTTKASIARVYDAGLNGKDNYEVDRQVVKQLAEVAPEIINFTWDHRNFLVRLTRFLASEAGITQFLDCGSGLPTAENTHQVAQRLNPETHVVYVDNDPVVLAHGRALLEENERTRFIAADLFEPRAILDNEIVRSHLDFSKPIALFQLGTLHHDTGQHDPGALMREYIDALAPGSYVGVSHFFDPENEDSALARRMEQVFVNSPMGSGLFRTRSEIEAMFPGLEMVPPGVSVCADWWPDGPRLEPLSPEQRCIVGGVGRKP